MNQIKPSNKRTALLCGLTVLSLALGALGGETKAPEAVTGGPQNRIVIKDFHFEPQTLTVKSGEKIIWVNKDEEPHTVVSVEKQFKKSTALDTDQEFTVTAGAPGIYSYFCSVHPKMTGTILVTKP